MPRRKTTPDLATLAKAAPAAAERVDKIRCPRQRAVARRVPEICDLFCTGLSRLPVSQRFVDQGAGSDEAERLRNAMRVYALGATFALGKNLGLLHEDLHGRDRGATKIAELKEVHRTTALNAWARFMALVQDEGDFGCMVRDRWQALRLSAMQEVEAAESSADGKGRAA